MPILAHLTGVATTGTVILNHRPFSVRPRATGVVDTTATSRQSRTTRSSSPKVIPGINTAASTSPFSLKVTPVINTAASMVIFPR
jgi:hypothetical protein